MDLLRKWMCYVNGSVMYIDVFSKWKCAVNLCFVSEWVSLELGLRFFSSCNGSTATVFFESKLFVGKY